MLLHSIYYDYTAGDAAAVARIFRNGNRPARAGSGAVVRNVVTIRRAAGRPAIYAVNPQEGCLPISATKRYDPISGRSTAAPSPDREPNGPDAVLQETIEAARDSAVVASHGFPTRNASVPNKHRPE